MSAQPTRQIWLQRTLALLLALCALFALARPALAQGDNNAWVIAAGQRVEGNVSTVAQDIVVDGEVAGDVTSWSGNITVTGHVGGDVVSYTGAVMVAGSAQVDGSIMALGGATTLSPSALVAGDTFNNTAGDTLLVSVVGFVVPQSNNAPGNQLASQVIVGAVLAFFAFAFCRLWVALWPRRTLAASITLRRVPVRATGLGLLSTLLLALLAPLLMTLLSAPLLGLPFLALLLLAAHIPVVYGVATLALALSSGERGASGQLGITAVLGLIAIGIGVCAAVAPVAGLALIYLLATPGLGAVILSRGGTALVRAA